MRAFEFFGGVPRATVPDNLESGVTRGCFYEPTVQRSYELVALHYGAAVLPAHVRKHKAKVEVGVQVAQRWILARLRNHVFHTLTALNEAVRSCLVDLNRRRMREYGKSRFELFESIERAPAATDRALRDHRVEEGDGEHRLSLRIRPAPVLGAPSLPP